MPWRRSRPVEPTGDAAASPLPAELAAGIRGGDAAAYDAFHDCYFERVYRYLLVVARGDEELAREAVQETLLRVLRYIKPLPDHDALWRWLTTVARTAFIDLTRRARQVGASPGVATTVVADPPQPDDELLDALDRALAQLPAAERRLVEAHYLAGTAQLEIAASHGTTRKAIESRLARIRKKLKALVLREVKRDG